MLYKDHAVGEAVSEAAAGFGHCGEGW